MKTKEALAMEYADKHSQEPPYRATEQEEEKYFNDSYARLPLYHAHIAGADAARAHAQIEIDYWRRIANEERDCPCCEPKEKDLFRRRQREEAELTALLEKFDKEQDDHD